MKTVQDAVSEFRGELSKYINDSHTLYYTEDREKWYFNNGLCPIVGVVVCTYKQFNQYIEDMETNFGKCTQTYSDYKFDYHLPPIDKPVYTQAMCDNGEWPSVGMECLINFPDIDNAWYKYTIDFMGKHTFIATCEDVSERFGHSDDVHFKPLTPPKTDKEKAIDQIYDSVYANKVIHNSVRDGHDDSIIEAVLNVAYDKWVTGSKS